MLITLFPLGFSGKEEMLKWKGVNGLKNIRGDTMLCGPKSV